MSKAETVKRLQAELAALQRDNTPQLDEDDVEKLLFRLNNIGYSLKRIADSLEVVAKHYKDQEEL